MACEVDNLLITTSNSIIIHSGSEERVRLSCPPNSEIGNSRAVTDGSGLIAIANSQIVILDDLSRGTGLNYDLGKRKEKPQILLFSPDSLTLFFTTALSHSVQVYSINSASLLAPLVPHPSPPNVLSISANGNVLLSASSRPPTIMLHNLKYSVNSSITLVPSHTRVAVTCASFHSNRELSVKDRFALGFQDGSLAIYAARVFPTAKINPESGALSRYPETLAVAQKLHKAAMGGMMSLSFLMRDVQRIVTLGHDGKCRLLCVMSGSVHILRTWRVFGVPTCLCVNLLHPSKIGLGRRGQDSKVANASAPFGDTRYINPKVQIAIGFQDGKVSFYDTLGLLQQRVHFSASIVCLQSVGAMIKPSTLSRRRPSLFELRKERQALATTDWSDATTLVAKLKDAVNNSSSQSSAINLPPPQNKPMVFPPSLEHHCPSSSNNPKITTPQNLLDYEISRLRPLAPNLPKTTKSSYPRPRILAETFIHQQAPVQPPPSSSPVIRSVEDTPSRSSKIDVGSPLSSQSSGVLSIREGRTGTSHDATNECPVIPISMQLKARTRSLDHTSAPPHDPSETGNGGSLADDIAFRQVTAEFQNHPMRLKALRDLSQSDAMRNGRRYPDNNCYEVTAARDGSRSGESTENAMDGASLLKDIETLAASLMTFRQKLLSRLTA